MKSSPILSVKPGCCTFEAEIEVRSRNNKVGESQILSLSLHILVPGPFCKHGCVDLAQQEASPQGRLSTPRRLLSSKVASASLPPLHQVADIYLLNLLSRLSFLILCVYVTLPQCIWLVPLLLRLLYTMEIQASKEFGRSNMDPQTLICSLCPVMVKK